jgi:hypothetical protein
MTVQELIAMLQQLPLDALVIASRDAEGNAFSPLVSEHSLGKWSETWRDFSEEADAPGEKAVALWPRD